MTKKIGEMTVDEINAEVEKVEKTEAELREVKRQLAAVRTGRVEFEAKVVRLSRLRDEEVEELVKDEKLKKAVVEFKAAAASRPKAQTASPEPVKTGAKVRK